MVTGLLTSRRAGAGGQRNGPDPTRRGGQGRPAAVVVACGALAVAAGVTGLALAGTAARARGGLGNISRVAVPGGPVAAAPDVRAGYLADGMVARPADLIIPAVGVRTRLVRLGLTADGTLQVPSSTAVAGWYTRSPRPGAVGASVIAGHVDSYLGPGVFFRLRLLHPPDRIYVRRTDGTLAVFRVIAVRQYAKSSFPASAVYGPAPGPQLRLITCGGTFDPARRAYLSNVVIYAIEIS